MAQNKNKISIFFTNYIICRFFQVLIGIKNFNEKEQQLNQKRQMVDRRMNVKYNRKEFMEESSDMEGDSLNSEDRRKIQAFNSDRSWQELDELEDKLFNGIVDGNSPEETYNKIVYHTSCGTSYRVKKPAANLREKKKQVVEMYEKELKRLRQDKDRKFYSPIDKPPLRINEDKFLETSIAIMGTESFVHNMAKKTGLKNSQNMSKIRMLEDISYCREYLESGKLPAYYRQQYEKMMNQK